MKETLHYIQPDQIQMVDTEVEIMEEVQIFFMDLFTQDEVVSRNSEERSVFNLITRKLPQGMANFMDRPRDLKELEGVVFGFPREKAPRLDGVTIEVPVGSKLGLDERHVFVLGLGLLEGWYLDPSCCQGSHSPLAQERFTGIFNKLAA